MENGMEKYIARHVIEMSEEEQRNSSTCTLKERSRQVKFCDSHVINFHYMYLLRLPFTPKQTILTTNITVLVHVIQDLL